MASVGIINQSSFSDTVQSTSNYGGIVNIISGVHGSSDGTTEEAYSMYTDDVQKFGGMPGVTVYNFPDIVQTGQITNLLNGPGLTIGGFCNSEACLAPYY